MRILGVLIMAGGLLGMVMGGDAAESGKVGAPRPNAMKTQATSNNPLDAVLDDVYRQEMSGKISHDQAMKIYGDAINTYLAKDPAIVKQHNENMDKRP